MYVDIVISNIFNLNQHFFFKPRLILVTHTDDHGWYITSNQRRKMFVQNLIRIVRKPDVMPRRFPYCITESIPIDLMFRENFPTHTQVWNCLSHRNECRQRRVIWVTYRCYKDNLYLVRNNSRQKVKCFTTCMGWADNQLTATGDSCEVKGCNSMTVRGRRTQPLLMTFQSPTNRKEGRASSACTAAIDTTVGFREVSGSNPRARF